MIWSASSSASIPCSLAMYFRYSLASLTVILLKSKIWQRDKMVGMILCFSVVAKIKIQCFGGSSKVFKKALKAAWDNMWTSSIIYTLYFPTCGGIRTWSVNSLIWSTPLLEAASNSKILKAKSSSKLVFSSLLIILARIRAQVVLPTPRGPVNNKACARWLCSIAFSSVFVMACWPTTSLKVCGLYLRADTTKCSIEILEVTKLKIQS